ncbi:MAG: hypothetical protein ABL973_06420 [Micropepsaceae bacterium]
MGVVFALVQVGAPIVRTFDFLDPKLRDYFIGMSFAAFPLIHRGCKQQLGRLANTSEPVLQDSAPWYVAGIVAAAVLFGWNQFVSLFALMSLEIMQSAYPDPQQLNLDPQVLSGLQVTAALVVILPLCAVASIYAGVQLNRHTRSHAIEAVGLAAICFMSINALLTWALNPEFMESIFQTISAGGPQALTLLLGMSMVAIIVFGFGIVGIGISRFNRERPLGKILEAARRLPAEQREALALEINDRVRHAYAVPASTVGMRSVTQLPTGDEP